MSDEQLRQLRELDYFSMTKRAWRDAEYAKVLCSDNEAAVSLHLGFAVVFAEMDAELRKHVDKELSMAKRRYSDR